MFYQSFLFPEKQKLNAVAQSFVENSLPQKFVWGVSVMGKIAVASWQVFVLVVHVKLFLHTKTTGSHVLTTTSLVAMPLAPLV